MEIRTCEEYVLNELEEKREQLLKLAEYNQELREKLKEIEDDLSYLSAVFNWTYNRKEQTIKFECTKASIESSYGYDIIEKWIKKYIK